MNGINLNRVLLGGLAAGIVVTFGEFVLWGLVLEERYQLMMATYGLAETSWAMTGYILGSLMLGGAVAFTYAAIRPRFGARWQTGIVAAGVVWFVGAALPMVWNGAIGLSVGAGAAVLALVWTAAEFSLAGVLAGRLYQEREVPAAARAPSF